MKTLKILFSMAIASVIAGCSGTGSQNNNEDKPKPTGDLTLSVDKSLIVADGTEFVTFTVTFKEKGGETKDVTKDAEIYFSDSDELLDGNIFSTGTHGDYTFYAAYGLNISDEVKVSAISVIPEIPEDPDEDGTEFHHRMMLIQHTGATCPNCPKMMTSLKALSEDEEYNSSYCLVASHSYYDGVNDAAYSPAAKTISSLFNSGSYPELTFNLTNTSTGYEYNDICKEIDNHRKESAHAGISAAVDAAAGEVMANAEFKFAKDGTYRIGAWLLEDNIFATQHGATENWHHTHNNALRAMYGEKQTECIYGTSVGETKAGSRTGVLFRFKLDKEWNAENCKVILFITEGQESGNGLTYDIVNCTVCKVGESAPYEYR